MVGGTGVESDLEVTTVAEVCREYVTELRRKNGDASARDAEKRFERTVYKDPLGAVRLDRVKTPRFACPRVIAQACLKDRPIGLDLKQRRKLIKASAGGLRDLMEAAALTGARAGELTAATCTAMTVNPGLIRTGTDWCVTQPPRRS